MASNENSDTPEAEATREMVLEMVKEDWEEEYERSRGILTDTDRKFLWGITSYKHAQTTSDRKSKIRERIVNGIKDLSYLTRLSGDQRGKIFEKIDKKSDSGELRSAVASLLQVLYLELDGDIEWFEETIAHGISNAEREMKDEDKTFYSGSGVDAGVSVDIQVTRGYDVDEIEERFRSGLGHTLTPAEVGVLVREGRVDPDELPALDSSTWKRLDPETGELVDGGPGLGMRTPGSSEIERDDTGDN